MSVPTKYFLFRRNNGFYYICYEVDGRKRWKSTKCRRRRDALKTLGNLKTLFKAKPRTTNLSEFLKEYLPHIRVNLRSSTAVSYEAALRQLLSAVGDIPTNSINRQHVDKYKLLRSEQVGANSVNIELRSLRSAFNVAQRWGLIDDNPFSNLQQIQVPEAPPSFLTNADFYKLLAIIEEDWLKELMVFAVATGMRRGEMFNLKWDDVDLIRRVVHIRSREGFKTKNGKHRIIPLNDVAYNLLVEKSRQPKQEYVFTRRGYKMGESYISHRFKYYVRKAGLGENIRWHSLRHTHASWLVQKGASLYEVQKLLGHSSSKVTEIYSHLQPEQLHDTVNKINIALN